jgi:hypothetical protein
VGALADAYQRIGLGFPDRSREGVARWAQSHEPGSHGQHTYDLAQFGLAPDQVRARFTRYLETYDAAL